MEKTSPVLQSTEKVSGEDSSNFQKLLKMASGILKLSHKLKQNLSLEQFTTASVAD